MNYGLSEAYQEELPFIREIMFDVDDDGARRIYADWLEERQDLRGEFLRLDMLMSRHTSSESTLALLRDKRRQMIVHFDPQWVSLLARCPIELCPQKVEFRYMCPNRWQNLKPFGDDQSVRYCDQCGKSVTYCLTIDEARSQAIAGQCVAVDPSVQRSPEDLTRYEGYPYELLGLLDIGE